MTQNQAINLLKANEINVTRKRVAIIQKIFYWEGLFSATDIYQQVGHDKNVDLATVYRFLSLLLEKNIIREIVDNKKSHLYEIAFHNPIHPHFKCKKCYKIFCLNPLTHFQTESLLNIAENHYVEQTNIIFNGLCQKCNN